MFLLFLEKGKFKMNDYLFYLVFNNLLIVLVVFSIWT